MAEVRPGGGGTLTSDRALPPVLRAALQSPGGNCYRHCDRLLRTRSLTSALPGEWLVRACPGGVVSVTQYSEWTGRDPTSDARATLEEWTVPPATVRRRDLRLATRHGPELGAAAERFLARTRPARGLRTVYWRVYPFRTRAGTERRLFVCLRTVHRVPVFFVSSPSEQRWGCPECDRRRASRGRR